MFYEMPLTETFKPKMENTKLGMVTVSGGDLTVQDVMVLRISSGKWFCTVIISSRLNSQIRWRFNA
jgi:hypothetical protein